MGPDYPLHEDLRTAAQSRSRLRDALGERAAAIAVEVEGGTAAGDDGPDAVVALVRPG